MLRTNTTALLSHVVQTFVRWLPRTEPDLDEPEWIDTDHSWHTSSFELARGVEVIEHFELPPLFPDTMPACHFPPALRAGIA